MVQKAYDLKELAEKFKKDGEPILEENAKFVWETLKSWLAESATVKGGLVASLSPLVIGLIDEMIKKQIDGIHKEQSSRSTVQSQGQEQAQAQAHGVTVQDSQPQVGQVKATAQKPTLTTEQK